MEWVPEEDRSSGPNYSRIDLKVDYPDRLLPVSIVFSQLAIPAL
jgi:hypothetical protein